MWPILRGRSTQQSIVPCGVDGATSRSVASFGRAQRVNFSQQNIGDRDGVPFFMRRSAAVGEVQMVVKTARTFAKVALCDAAHFTT